MFRRKKRANLWTGAAAGLAGGLAASLAMGLAHAGLSKLFGVKARGGPQDATVLTAERLLGRELSPREREIAGPLVHYAFGSTLGAAYGALGAAVPAATRGAGLPFGLGAWAGAHATVVPALGLSESPLSRPLGGEAVEFAAHLVYGAVTEGVRRGVLAALP